MYKRHLTEDLNYKHIVKTKVIAYLMNKNTMKVCFKTILFY